MGNLLRSLIESAGIMCPDKVKDFQNISLMRNAIAERTDDTGNILRTTQLCNISKHFEAFSIAMELWSMSHNLQCFEVRTRSLLLLKNFYNEFPRMVHYWGRLFHEVQRLLQKYELSLSHGTT
jgi:hypothetical protein